MQYTSFEILFQNFHPISSFAREKFVMGFPQELEFIFIDIFDVYTYFF